MGHFFHFSFEVFISNQTDKKWQRNRLLLKQFIVVIILATVEDTMYNHELRK